MKNLIPGLLLLCLFLPLPASARWIPSGGVTATGQFPDHQDLSSEWSGSADLVLTYLTARGHEWRFYGEANTSPRAGGVSTFLPEANADAGSAVDSDNDGRVQISEVSYRHLFAGDRSLTLGLVDISSYFDQSRIASDENTQFLGVPFVQNPTIEFPDYAVGLIYEHAFSPRWAARAGVTSSHGLADNPNHSYAQLVDIDNADKGLFVAAAAAWEHEVWLARAGVWAHTAAHEALSGPETDRHNKGAYLLTGWRRGHHGVNLRLGLANQKVSRAAGFTAVTYRWRPEPLTLGLGLARIFVSDQAPEPEARDTSMAEIYVRYRLRDGLLLTGNYQSLVNSAFGLTGMPADKAVQVAGLRLTFLF